MTDNHYLLPRLNNYSRERNELDPLAWLALLENRRDRFSSGSETIVPDGSAVGEHLPSAVSIEAPDHFLLVSNFRSRSRHRRGMPSPVTART